MCILDEDDGKKREATPNQELRLWFSHEWKNAGGWRDDKDGEGA